MSLSEAPRRRHRNLSRVRCWICPDRKKTPPQPEPRHNVTVIPASNPTKAPELRERTLGERLDASIKIVSANFRVLFPMAAIMVFPFQVLIALSTISIIDDLNSKDPAKIEFSSGQIGSIVAVVVLGLVATVVVTGALTWFIAEFHLGRRPKVGESLSYAIRRTPATIGSYLVSSLGAIVASAPAIALIVAGVIFDSAALIIIGGIAFFVVFIWFFIRVSAAVPAIIVERLGPVGSVKRSFGLTKGFWRKVFVNLIVTSLLTGIVAQLLQTVITGILGALGGDNKTFEFMWAAIAGTVATGVTTPVSAAMAVLIYLELRVRKEGFDLEVLASSLAS